MSNLTAVENEGITVVTLNDGKANTLGPEMVNALTQTAEALAPAAARWC